MDAEVARAFDPGPGGQVRQRLERPEELRPAIRITRIVDAVDPDEDIEGAERLGPGQGQREEDRVPGGYIGDRDSLRDGLFGRSLGTSRSGREGAAAEAAQVDFELDMSNDAQGTRDPARGFELDRRAAVRIARSGR